MKTCANCIAWRRVGYSPIARRMTYDTGVVIVPAGEEGQCRAATPVDDFKWPLTGQGDWCLAHTTAPKVATDDALARVERELDEEAKLRSDASGDLNLAHSAGSGPAGAASTGSGQAADQSNLGAGPNGTASPAGGMPLETGMTGGGVAQASDTGNRRPARSARRG